MEQIAKDYANIRVNKKSCSVKVHGFQRKFLVEGDSLLKAAKLANAYYEAGQLYYGALSTLTKNLCQNWLAYAFLCIYIHMLIYIHTL